MYVIYALSPENFCLSFVVVAAAAAAATNYATHTLAWLMIRSVFRILIHDASPKYVILNKHQVRPVDMAASPLASLFLVQLQEKQKRPEIKKKICNSKFAL